MFMLCLVVDDDRSIRTLVRSIIRSEGFDTLEAQGGTEVLKVVREREGSVDLIITDVQMPEGDGVTLASDVTRMFPGIRVILMSGYSGCAGNSDFIAKPFSKDSMLDVVRRVLARAA
jgi:two-component system cell cycle sensor histidine kinase/response regulator CckA